MHVYIYKCLRALVCVYACACKIINHTLKTFH